jgi:hypothetical protein
VPPYTRRMDTQPPLEDINAIVSRFQAWAGAQTAANGKHGVRELTYEEAIRSTRRRTTASEKPAVAAPPPAPNRVKRAAGRKASAAEPVKIKKRAPLHARRSTCKKKTLSPTKPKAPPAQPSAVFRHVLAAQVLPVAVVPALSLVAESRSTALSLRMSPGEHSLVKAHAAEANLSVSAYLRTCLFEVENLRIRLRQLQTVTAYTPVRTSIFTTAFASCAQFLRRLVGGKTTTLVVRA